LIIISTGDVGNRILVIWFTGGFFRYYLAGKITPILQTHFGKQFITKTFIMKKPDGKRKTVVLQSARRPKPWVAGARI